MVNDIMVYENTEEVEGFTFQEGFASWNENGVKCATSGWTDNGSLHVYHLIDGKWISSWSWLTEYEKIVEGISAFKFEKAMKVAAIEAETLRSNNELFISNEELRFTNTVPGKACNNGGEYGEYTVFTPTDVDGIYAVSSESTCDFGREEDLTIELVALSISEYKTLREESDRIEKAGFLG